MFRAELSYFIVLTVIILFSGFLPTNLLLLLDSFIVRALIVLLLLYLISIGPTAGILGLMAISMLYLERNRRKVLMASKKLDAMDFKERPATVEEAAEPQKTVPVRAFDKPDNEEVDYLPHEGCSMGDFEPVAPTINKKEVMNSVYPLNGREDEKASAPNGLYERMGYGHIPGVETIG